MVFLDMDTCKLPKYWDSRIIGSEMKVALMKAGVPPGPLTITAIGIHLTTRP